MPHALAFEGVSHSFGKLEALSRVHLHVEEGDIYGFLGLNGAGKTTAIRLVLGLVHLRSGEIRLLGAPLRGPRPLESYRRTGVLFEDFAAHEYLSGFDHVVLHGRLLGMSRREARAAAGLWLERVGIAAKARVRVRGYSLGMKRRLGIACALVGSPRVVILDEPTNGLDPRGIADLRALVLDLNRESGVTFFLSSHILGEVEQLCRTVGIIHRGRMLAQGTVAELTGRGRQRRRIRVAPAARALDLLRSAPWCRGVDEPAEPSSPARRAAIDGAPRWLQAEVDAPDVPRMVRELVTAGVDVHEVSEASERLEAVFHRTVSAAEREEALAAGGEAA
jgi:ABC-2 type transport system ATP-binding protein